jgi:hypothetical protein
MIVALPPGDLAGVEQLRELGLVSR